MKAPSASPRIPIARTRPPMWATLASTCTPVSTTSMLPAWWILTMPTPAVVAISTWTASPAPRASMTTRPLPWTATPSPSMSPTTRMALLMTTMWPLAGRTWLTSRTLWTSRSTPLWRRPMTACTVPPTWPRSSSSTLCPLWFPRTTCWS